MKKIGILVLTAMCIGFFFADVALAGRVGNRQVRQQKRIHQGIKSGELTGKEACNLERQQYRIQQSKRQAWSDGKMTPREKLRLERQQDRASDRVYMLKHNE
ncbi:MAG: hypothetical protein SV686_06910 [Thermodesulfobacteriota bacterium]|nr:hypothetical protein [Thermodesulfobacteriota bacterium]